MPHTVQTGPGAVLVLVAATGGLAAAMGVGRFAYTPLLPIMVDATGLTPSTGAVVAAANYAGYLVGAVALALRPRWGDQRRTVAGLAALLVLSEFAMPAVAHPAGWGVLRFLAGVASAGLFVGCVRRVTRILGPTHRGAWGAGIAFSGVGLGIALTGALVAVLDGRASWQAMWLVLAVLTAALLAPLLAASRRGAARPVPAGSEGEAPSAGEAPSSGETPSAGEPAPALPGWPLLTALYFLEGLGYIIVGTFLVASVETSSAGASGSVAWIVVGLTAAPGTVVWSWLGHRLGSRPALCGALALQAAGAALPTLGGGTVAALTAAALFGATFMGVTALAIRVGVELRGPNAAGPLTAVYGVGQLLGPLVVAPALGSSYTTAFRVAVVVVSCAAVLAALAQLQHQRHVDRRDGHVDRRDRRERVARV